MPGGPITVVHKSTFTLSVDTLSGASCTLSEPTYGTLPLGVAGGSTPSFTVVWGGPPPKWPWWAIGTYTVTATCTLSGYSPGWATKTVKVIKAP